MSGKKGRSGRKSWEKEAQTRELWELSIPVLKHVLKSKKRSLATRKVDVALSLIMKMAPSELKHSGDIGKDTNVIVIRSSAPTGEKIVGDTTETVSREIPIQP